MATDDTDVTDKRVFPLHPCFPRHPWRSVIQTIPANRSIKSTTRFEYPHSLSYHATTRA